MTKYGEQDKDSLKAENASLRQQVEFYEDEDHKARDRALALSYATGLFTEGSGVKAQDIVTEAQVFENYLSGKPDEDDPEVVVPSPS